jgi:hypothetical protein
MAKPKLVIHETDCHGYGKVHYNGRTESYSYDGYMGDVRVSVEGLIEIGFIDREDVLIFDEKNEAEMYNILAQNI